MNELLLKLLDFLLGGLLERRRQRQALAKNFDAIRRRIIYLNLMNDLPLELKTLRDFFLEHGLVERPEFQVFFHKWLSHPVLQLGMPATGLYTVAEFHELKVELTRLQV